MPFRALTTVQSGSCCDRTVCRSAVSPVSVDCTRRDGIDVSSARTRELPVFAGASRTCCPCARAPTTSSSSARAITCSHSVSVVNHRLPPGARRMSPSSFQLYFTLCEIAHSPHCHAIPGGTRYCVTSLQCELMSAASDRVKSLARFDCHVAVVVVESVVDNLVHPVYSISSNSPIANA